MTDTGTVHRNAKTQCRVCKKWFEPKRTTAKYCGSGCRQTAKRDKARIHQRVRTVKQLIAEIVRTDSEHKLAALKEINRTIKYEVMQATGPGKELINAIHEYMKA